MNHSYSLSYRRLTYTGHSNMKTRGLLVLLLSKAAGHPPNSIDFIDAQRSAGISQRQRSLAEMTEMIYSAHLIHKGIVNLQPSLLVNSKKAQDLHFGNKMSVLSGDFLLASVWKGLGELRDTKVVELMSIAVGDFMEGQFVIETETDLPHLGKTSKTYWEQRNFLRAGSLQANSCQSALALAGHGEELQLKAYEFGKNVALAWQAFTELQPFMESYMHPVNTVAAFELMSAPIILHVENNGESLESTVIQGGEDGETQIDYQRLHSIVRSGPGIDKTKELITLYTNNALDALQVFPPSDASKALANIVYAIKEQ